MTNLLHWVKKAADGIAASLLAAMFVIFILQIVTRYVIAAPLGWTVEVLLTLWLWLVFWASAFCVKDKEHIRFDMLSRAVPRGMRRLFAIIAALLIATAFAWSFLPTLDYILFYKIKKSAVLRVRLDYIFSIYGVFVVAIVCYYAWRVFAHIHPGLYQKYYDHDEHEAPGGDT